MKKQQQNQIINHNSPKITPNSPKITPKSPQTAFTSPKLNTDENNPKLLKDSQTLNKIKRNDN